MKLHQTDSPLSRTERNQVNENWKTIEDDFNNVVSVISDEAVQQVIDSAKLIWQKPVDTYEDIINTYLNPTEGWAVMATNDSSDYDQSNPDDYRKAGTIWRYNGADWEPVQQIDPTVINEVEDRLNQKIDEDMNSVNQQLAEAKKYTGLSVNAKYGGAIGDGVADDSVILNQLLLDNPYVVLPDGEYNLNNPLYIPFGHQLVANNPQRVSLNANFENEFAITYGDNYYYNGYRGKVSGFRIKTSNDNLLTKPKGIYINSGLEINEIDFYTIGQLISRSTSYIDLIDINKIYSSYCVPNGEYLINIDGNTDGLRINQLKFAAFSDDDTNFNGIYINKCHGGSINNSILNCNVTINSSNAFSINDSHNEAIEGQVIVKDSNITLNNFFKFKNSIKNDFVISSSSNDQFQNIAHFNNVNSYILGHLAGNESFTDEVEKTGNATLKLTNCSRVINLGDSGSSSMINTGFTIKGVPQFNNHSSKLSLDGLVTTANEVVESFGSDGIIPVSSIGSIAVSSRIPWKIESDSNRTYHYRGAHIIDVDRKLINFRSSSTSIAGVTYDGYGVALNLGRSKEINGKGGVYLLVRGDSSTNFTEECYIPLTTGGYLLDDGLNVNGYPWQSRTGSNLLNDYTMPDKIIKNGDQTTIYYHTTPTIGTWEKGDKVINNQMLAGNVKEWIYDGVSWLESGTW